jgi:hypothetical protein
MGLHFLGKTKEHANPISFITPFHSVVQIAQVERSQLKITMGVNVHLVRG